MMDTGQPKYIGIAEVVLGFVNQPTADSQATFNLHILFNVKGDYLFAHCLDTGNYSRLNLKERVRELSQKQGEEIARTCIAEIFDMHFKDIADHILACGHERILYPFSHVDESYWKIFRDMRMNRDNYKFNELFGNITEELEVYRDLEDNLTETITAIKGEAATISYSNQFISIVEELIAA
jgi:hypothetical protein